jgi:hypothetical protein
LEKTFHIMKKTYWGLFVVEVGKHDDHPKWLKEQINGHLEWEDQNGLCV